MDSGKSNKALIPEMDSDKKKLDLKNTKVPQNSTDGMIKAFEKKEQNEADQVSFEALLVLANVAAAALAASESGDTMKPLLQQLFVTSIAPPTPGYGKTFRPRRQLRADPVKICTNYFCKTRETPMWRKGPLGIKSLCNACGIRYVKQLKRTCWK